MRLPARRAERHQSHQRRPKECPRDKRPQNRQRLGETLQLEGKPVKQHGLPQILVDMDEGIKEIRQLLSEDVDRKAYETALESLQNIICRPPYASTRRYRQSSVQLTMKYPFDGAVHLIVHRKSKER